MKAVLLQDIKSLGKKGELVEVSTGYARNYLFPRNLAKEADKGAMNELKNAEASKKYKTETEISNAKKAKEELEGKVFVIKAKCGKSGKLFGRITQNEIAQEIKRQKNIDVDKRKITIDGDIKNLGEYDAEIKFYSGINAKVRISVEGA